MPEHLKALSSLGERFHGIDLSFRNHGVDWPKLWRAKTVSTKRPEYAIIVYGDTPQEAIVSLIVGVNLIDRN
jgi:hypothetical protein